VSKSKPLFVLGYSGHAYVVIDVAFSNGFTVQGYFDKNQAISDPYDIPFLGDENVVRVKEIVGKNYVFPAMGSNCLRKKVLDFISLHSLTEVVLIDSSAAVSTQAVIEHSTFIAPNAVVNSLTRVGRGCIINTGAIVEHECVIDDFTHIAPGAVLAGNVKVGKNVFIGANSVVKQGTIVGDNAIVGAGTVVIKDIPEGETWIGNPAKKL